MADFNDEKSKEILDLIKEKTGGFRCPLCNNGKINLIQREAVIPFPDEKEGNFVLSPNYSQDIILPLHAPIAVIPSFSTETFSSKMTK